MKIIAISDTHGQHQKVKIPEGDLLIHAGDITEYGTESEVKDFLRWFSKQPCAYKVFIAGNHDLFFDQTNFKKNKMIADLKVQNVFYLQNSGIVLNGLKIWGSPVTPYFLGMAFNKQRGEEIRKTWSKIPNNTDILITHSPPYGILDNDLGCEELLAKVIQRKPKLHVFGHIHNAYGIFQENEMKFVNASLTNTPDPISGLGHRVVNVPVVCYL
jgi:Icc-related predicted phosphoesterase